MRPFFLLLGLLSGFLSFPTFGQVAIAETILADFGTSIGGTYNSIGTKMLYGRHLPLRTAVCFVIKNNPNMVYSPHGYDVTQYSGLSNLYTRFVPMTLPQLEPNGQYYYLGQTQANDSFLHGSRAYYMRDFEVDDQDNIIGLGDNLTAGWDPTNINPNAPLQPSNLIIYRLNHQFQTQWYKQYGGSAHDYAVKVRLAPDNNLIVLARSYSSNGNLTGNNGGSDIWLMKLDVNTGNIIWQNNYGGPGDEIPNDMEVLPDGSVVICGTSDASAFLPSSFPGKNAFLLKVDSMGNPVWTKVFAGSDEDSFVRLCTMGSSGFAVLAESKSNNGDFPTNVGGVDVHLKRVDAAGNQIWTKQLGDQRNDAVADLTWLSCDSQLIVAYSNEFKFFLPGYPPAVCRMSHFMRIDPNAQVIKDYLFDPTIITFYLAKPHSIEDVESVDGRNFVVNYTEYMENAAAGPYRFPIGGRSCEYGYLMKQTEADSTFCSSIPYNGVYFTSDTTLRDTLRNGCGLDTAIVKMNLHPISTATQVTYSPDTTVCYGSIYRGVVVDDSINFDDTVYQQTSCGNITIIKRLKVKPSVLPALDLGPNRTLCEQPINLQFTKEPGWNYVWQNQSTTNNQAVASSGIYWVEATDSKGCSFRDSVTIFDTDLHLWASNDTTIDCCAPIQLSASSNGTIIWQSHATLHNIDNSTVSVNPNASTLYVVSAEKDDCVLSDSVFVKITSTGVWIPNTFSPNGDGRNDVFRISGPQLQDFSMQIYNRWGELIFSTRDQLQGWTGQVRGKLSPVGSYAYMIRFTDDAGQAIVRKGTITLIR